GLTASGLLATSAGGAGKTTTYEATSPASNVLTVHIWLADAPVAIGATACVRSDDQSSGSTYVPPSTATKARFAISAGVASEPAFLISEVNVKLSPVTAETFDLLTTTVSSPTAIGAPFISAASCRRAPSSMTNNATVATSAARPPRRIICRSFPADAAGPPRRTPPQP